MQHPPGVGTFEFVVLASLRAAQLMRGCRPKIDGDHKKTVTAQLEIAQGKVSAQPADAEAGAPASSPASLEPDTAPAVT
jgi:DNA-directed RNA polymerase subunit K/omega